MVNIIVVFPKADDARNIRNVLVRGGHRVAAVCTSGAQVLQCADDLGEGIVVCGYKYHDMFYRQLKEDLPGSFEMLLIASAHVLEECPKSGIVCLPLPLKVNHLLDTLDMMIGSRQMRQKKERQKPKPRTLEEQKLIMDAKGLLMERNGMTEEEAHRYMQKCSMDSGTNLVETAHMLLALMRC